ncbi:hypothetical protein CAEBREN_22099 [Caenorhabditis brenneri]|uniref:Sdz-33 F-box domain-containing protein n=1 Tax=Caenorhabditis brenneri TaxID=135651 RepID=G0MFQ4_CAEBE|nr:hypothetical protein CAEBREN_22099 [Caenorhabditis brenneri]
MSGCYDLHQLYKLGLEGKRQRSAKRRKGFELLWLPVLARIEVIRSMDIDEIIYFQTTMRKIFPCKSGLVIDKTSSSFRKSVAILKHLQSIISFKSLCLHVNLKGMTAEFFKEILTEPSLRDFESLGLENGEIDAECLDLVMGMAQSNRNLHIKGTMIPRDYYHENAFKFHDIYYNDAEWVCIENLLTLKDSYSVNLGWNLLTQHDVNTFIKFWIDSDHDMIQSLSFRLLLAFRIERFFDDVVVLKGRPAIYLVVANPTKQRKRPILRITCPPNGMLCLKSCFKDETFRLRGSLTDESWAPEYKVLMILNKKKELKGKLEEIQKLLETSQDQNMVERKNEIARELENVSLELDSLSFVLRDGVYSYT